MTTERPCNSAHAEPRLHCSSVAVESLCSFFKFVAHDFEFAPNVDHVGRGTPNAPPEPVASELARLYREARRGELEPAAATRLTSVLVVLRGALEPGEFERRLDALEAAACRRPGASGAEGREMKQPTRRRIEARKAGLAAAKVRGVKLGNVNIAAANRDAALDRAEQLRPIFAELTGMSAGGGRRQAAAGMRQP